MKKVALFAWIRTLRLLIKHRFSVEKARKEADQEITDTVSKTIIKNAYHGNEIRN